ncbi:tetratricopeptide repeat protein [candidate division CSSED10-310 bacterium]|uniref:Tetratricopeptide repeat protein n=1 Tax=candidate division CSSED10-310 bacterium TaxID=2855610 RepID=A0ABV6YXG0_UNCC1
MLDDVSSFFQDIVTPEILDVHLLRLKEGERRVVSVIFCNIVDFSGISEKLDSEKLRFILDKLFQIFTYCINQHGGYVDKYGGGMVMALFGAKVARENDAARAVSAGLHMLAGLTQFNNALEKANLPTKKLNIRIGINTGRVTTGKIGAEREGDFTVYGDAVNVAARLEDASPINRILISDSTMRLIKNKFEVEPYGDVEVKGKSEPITTYLVSRSMPEESYRWHIQNTSFFGRDSELEILLRKLESVQNYLKKSKLLSLSEINNGIVSDRESLLHGITSSAVIVDIVSEAGLGKSRLVFEFLERLPLLLGTQRNSSSSIAPLMCRIPPYAQRPYCLFSEILRVFFNIQRTDSLAEMALKFDQGYSLLEDTLIPDEKQTLYEVKPMIGHLLGIKYPDNRLKLDPDKLQYELQIALRYFIEILSKISFARDFPLILIFEDMQWVDEASEKMLYYLFKTFIQDQSEEDQRYKHFLAILTHRPEFRITGANKTLVDYTEMDLLPLKEKHVGKLLSELLPDAEMTDSFYSMLLEKTAGNPLYIEEWSQLIRNIPLNDKSADKKKRMSDWENTSIPTPDSLSAIILARIDQLDQSLKAVLQKAAIVRQDFSLELLEFIYKKINTKPEITLKASIDRLVEQGFIYQTSPGTFSFKSKMMQEVAYNVQLRSNRKILHEIVASYLSHVFSDNLDEIYADLAYHYDMAQVADYAVEFLEKAGDQAKKLFDYREAIRHYNRTLEYLSLKWNDFFLDPSEKEIKPHTAEYYRVLIKTNRDFEKTVKVGTSLAKLLVFKGDWENAEILFRNICELVKEHGDTLAEARAQRDLGCFLIHKGKYDDAFELLEDAYNIFDAQSENKLSIIGQCDILGEMGKIYWLRGDLDMSLQLFEKQAEQCQAMNERLECSIVTGRIGLIYFYKGQYDKAMLCYQQQLSICEEYNDKWGIGNAAGNIGIVHLEKGEYDLAMQCYNRHLNICEQLDDNSGINVAIGNMGNVFVCKGEYDKALNCFQKKKEICEEMGDQKGLSIAVGNMGRIYSFMKNNKSALEYFSIAIKLSQDLGLNLYLCGFLKDKASILLELNCRDQAKILCKKALLLSKKLGNPELLFHCRLLDCKINSTIEDNKNCADFVQFLSDDLQPEHRALLNYELYKFNGKLSHKQEALKIYNKLLSEKYNHEYKIKIDEMESNTE